MITLEDGAYTIEVALTGGSGRADVDSPAHLTVNQGQMQAQIVWSSPYYDYMEVDGRGYAPINEEGNSVFSIAVPALDEEIAVSAETVAMSMPHTIEYTLRFDSSHAAPEGVSPADWGMGTVVAVMALAVIALLALRRPLGGRTMTAPGTPDPAGNSCRADAGCGTTVPGAGRLRHAGAGTGRLCADRRADVCGNGAAVVC